MLKATKALWPWVLGITLGLVAGTFQVGLSPAGADADEVAVYEVDFSKELTRSDIEELIRFRDENPGVDLILKPVEGYRPPSGEQRRKRDDQRAAQEARELQQQVAQGYADGIYVDGTAELPSCVISNKSWAAMEPGRQLLCNGEVVSARPRLEFRRAATSGELEDLLRQRLYDLLDGVTPEEKALGFSSHFSNSAALESLSIDSQGAVVVDFNEVIESQVGGLHPGYATHTMLQQIFRTLFQFRDVAAVRLTLHGNCEAFGDMIGGPCQDLDRDLWEQMIYENREDVKFFHLKGVN